MTLNYPANGRRSRHVIAMSVAMLFLLSLIPTAFSDEPDLIKATSKGSRHWNATFGGSYDSKLGHAYVWQGGVNHYLLDGLAFSYGVVLGYARARRTEDGIYGGPQFGLLWHVLRGKRWSFDIEGLAAAVVHRHPLTEESLRFNFDLQPGLGITYMLGANTMLRGGCRWHHLSNARVRGKEHNLGYDGPMGYVGIAHSF